MRTVDAFDVQVQLAQLLNEVAVGNEIIITKDGEPMATFAPVKEIQRRTAREAIDALRAFRLGNTLGGIPVRELIDEGRRL